MSINAREAALKALSRVRRTGAWSDAALNSVLLSACQDDRDKALVSRIFYGVIQNLSLCDYYIAAFSSVKPSKMEPQVLDILRMSVYQLVFMSKIPVNAAVHEGVELTKKHANPRAAGLVNAVLRKIASNLQCLPSVTGTTEVERLSILYSHPQELVSAFIARLGKDGAAELLEKNNGDAAITVILNPLKTDISSLIVSIQNDQAEVGIHPWLENCLELHSAHQIERLEAFRGGAFYVQDPAAVLSIQALGLQKGMFVIDGCAAPGGKSFAAAIGIGDSGKVLSCDINEKKLLRVSEGVKRLGLTSIETRIQDAREQNAALIRKADIVIADVPCSGYGVIRKKPEIRYKPINETEKLPELQLQILNNLAEYVKPGGVVLYSTCTLLERENEGVIQSFLNSHSDFEPEGFLLPGPVGEVATGMVTLWPHIHGTDGFFICKLRRKC